MIKLNISDRRIHGGAAPKVLLLIILVAMLAGFFVWKDRWGIIGHVQPMPRTTGYIAYIQEDKAGRHNIFLIKPDGAGLSQLTDDKDNKLTLSWSPDGKHLCYAGEAHDERGVTSQLFLLGSDGIHQLTQGSGGKDEPHWRPDGKQIAYLTGGAIKLVDSNGTPGDQIYPPPHKGNSDTGGNDTEDESQKRPPIRTFRWSPDGHGIAAIQITEGDQAPVVGQADWFQKGAANNPQQITVPEPETIILLSPLDSKPQPLINTNCRELGFDWLPDSTRIAVSLITHGPQHGIGVFRTDDIRLPPMGVLSAAGYTIGPRNLVVSPDGKQVAFEVSKLSSAEDSSALGIAVLPLDSDRPLTIKSAGDLDKLPLKIKGEAYDPRWSPDGAKLLYTMAGPSGRTLWVANADGSNPVQLTKDGNIVTATWSPAK